MTRRDLIALLESTAAFSWPLSARGQQPRLPSIGFLGTTTASAWAAWKTAFVDLSPGPAKPEMRPVATGSS
jgi:hypothetical protein